MKTKIEVIKNLIHNGGGCRYFEINCPIDTERPPDDCPYVNFKRCMKAHHSLEHDLLRLYMDKIYEK